MSENFITKILLLGVWIGLLLVGFIDAAFSGGVKY
jgi:hypothetical protein